MIDATSSAAASQAYSLSLPKQTTQTGVQGSVFGTIFSENSSQFATQETADALAKFLGAKVVDESSSWIGGSPGALYGIQFNNGKLLNAGLLVDRFNKYGVASGLQMTEAEIGGSIQITPMVTPVTNSSGLTLSASADTAGAAGSSSASASGSIVNRTATSGNGAMEATAADEAITIAAASAAQTLAKNTDVSGLNAAKDDPEKLTQAARQFEALLVGQLLKSSSEGHEDGLFGGGGSSESSSLMEMAQEQFAQAISAQGGLGLADMIVNQVGTTDTTVPTRS